MRQAGTQQPGRPHNLPAAVLTLEVLSSSPTSQGELTAPTLPKPHRTLSILTSVNAPPFMNGLTLLQAWLAEPRPQACGAPESRDPWARHPQDWENEPKAR